MKPYSPKGTPSSNERLNKAMKDSSPYIAERKLDGCRYLTLDGRIVSPRISTTTNKNVDKTDHLPQLRHLLEGRMVNTMLDGEVCTGLHNSKAQDVVRVMGCLEGEAVRRQKDQEYLHYVVFDILRSPEGVWLHNKPWSFRRQMLDKLSKEITTDYVHLLQPVRKGKEDFLQDELDKGGEGVVLKHKDGKYAPGKRPAWNWIKLKTELEDDVVIIGFDPPNKAYTGDDPKDWPYWEEGQPVSKHYAKNWIGAIRFGKYDKNGNLVELGSCSGMTEQQRKMLSEDPKKFINRVAVIKAMERTRDGMYRHPSFVRLHSDKNPEECVIDSEGW